MTSRYMRYREEQAGLKYLELSAFMWMEYKCCGLLIVSSHYGVPMTILIDSTNPEKGLLASFGDYR